MIVARLTERDDVTKSLLRGAPRLGLVLGPAPARAGPDDIIQTGTVECLLVRMWNNTGNLG